jgi:hypothetical protein
MKIDPLEGWKSSNYWEQPQQIKILLSKKLRADWCQGMFAVIWCRILCLSVCYQKFKDENIQNNNFAYCLYGCETWSLTLREESRLRVFENRVLSRIFCLKRDDVKVEWRNYMMMSSMICTAHQQFCGWWSREKWDRTGL